MKGQPSPSFSAGRKWVSTLNVLLSVGALLAIILMVNYLGARHFTRGSLSQSAPLELSALTLRVLESVTNRLRVTVFFDKSDPLYESVLALLREYRYANNNVAVQTVDYLRDPAADLIKSKYKLTQLADKNLVIFEYNDRTKFVQYNELSTLDIDSLVAGRSKEIRRTHFKGELMFTSAIFSLVSARPLQAYFLQNHKEHAPDSDDDSFGFSKFAALLKRNNVDWEGLNLAAQSGIPENCDLLIIAGPSVPLLPEELAKIGQYLQSGGRLLLLFNYFGLGKNPGLAGLLSKWGVLAGENVVLDPTQTSNREDLLLTQFGLHPIVKPMVGSVVHINLPRSVQPDPLAAPAAGAPEAIGLLYTSQSGTLITDIRKGIPYAHPGSDVVTNVCVGVAVEKGRIRDVTPDRGTTRMVVLGDSTFLSNRMIDSVGNSDFGALAVNWLLDRSELLGSLPPKPISEYRTTLSSSQMTTVRLVMMVAMPGAVLLLGTLVWIRRRS